MKINIFLIKINIFIDLRILFEPNKYSFVTSAQINNFSGCEYSYLQNPRTLRQASVLVTFHRGRCLPTVSTIDCSGRDGASLASQRRTHRLGDSAGCTTSVAASRTYSRRRYRYLLGFVWLACRFIARTRQRRVWQNVARQSKTSEAPPGLRSCCRLRLRRLSGK